MATATLPSKPGILRSLRGAEKFAWFVVAYNVLVILWGALVRATGSGAGCGNHWPLCNGVVIPISPTLHTIIEFTHRQMVTLSVFTMIALVVWTWRSTVKGMAARVFVTLSGILLLNEAFLGAMLVKLGYVTGNQSTGRVILLSIHLSNTLLLVAAMTTTAIMLGTSQRWSELHARGTAKVGALLGLLSTLVVGVSGSLAALGDTLFPADTLRAAFAQDIDVNSPMLLRLRGIHPVSAFIAAACVSWLIVQARRQNLGKLANWVIGLLAVQFLLGIADVILLAPTWMQIVHLLGADLYWVALVMLATGIAWPKTSTPVAANNQTNLHLP